MECKSDTFKRLVKVDDHVQEIKEESYSLYWAELNSPSQQFDTFLKNPLPDLQQQFDIPQDYRVQTTALYWQGPALTGAACALLTVIPSEKLVHITVF